ncbi:MAG: M14 family metallopeptidase, partial [candidate division Zixibacteria bacterium]
ELISDPRKLKSKSEADRLFADLPAVVWAGYGIHGDELSSTDAAIAVAYQLVAGADDDSRFLLDNLVVVIDPMQNPDGRERFLTQVRQFSGRIPNPDLQSVQHTGVWPSGRGNHYFIDLNRDMFTLVHPETRGKISVCMEWRPQLMIDSHEMGALSTYLFSPPREPFNPHWPSNTRKWWDIFAADQAKAFDQYGWSYFTREWNEELFPGYTSSWGIFLGMVGILYEQAGVDGTLVKRKTGEILTFAESVHHHIVSSMANLKTAAVKRKELLRHYHDARRVAVENKENSIGGSFMVDPAQNSYKVNRFIETLLLQGIEIKKAESDFNVTGLYNENGPSRGREFSAGTYIIDFAQPSRNLLQVLLDYDIRISNKALFEERRSIEKNWGSRMYEVSAWNLPLAFGLESYISNKKVSVSSVIVSEITKSSGTVSAGDPLYGYMVHYTDDAATYFLAEAFPAN